MMNRRLAGIYGFATAGVLVAGLSPWWLSPLIGDTPPMRLMLVLVVTASAWLGGLGPGAYATAMGAAAIVLANDQPGRPFVLAERLARFGSLSTLIVLLFALVHVQRRRAEQRERALARSEVRHRRFIEAAAEGIWAIDRDGRTTYASPRLGEILGLPPEAILGRPLAEFLADPGGRRPIRIRTTGEGQDWCEVRLRGKEGAIRDAMVTVRPIAPDDDSGSHRIGGPPESGTGGGFLLMVSDVTPLKQAERALREKESLLRSFYQSSAAAMGVLESVGDDVRILSANAPTDRLFGRGPGEVEGKTARELGMSADRLAAWREHLRRCRETGRPVRLEERGAWPDGSEWVAATFAPMVPPGDGDGDGDGDGLCSFLIEDVTERKRAEAEIHVAKEQAEAASRAKDRFLAVLSHELRTPLTPVMIAVSSMIESNADPAILPELEMIRRNIELESRLIDDLLDLSRIARGRLRLDLEVVDMHQALRRAAEICREETFVAGLEVFLVLEAREYHVWADHARIMQIAWNLVRNAAKFTPAGGRLIVRTSNEPGPAPGVANLVVEFADTGIGIAPELLPRIFEAFEQGYDDLRRRSRGLGLGLAIGRSLAEAMGGRLTATSPGPGLGSTFRLEIATVPAPAAAPAPASIATPGRGRDEPVPGGSPRNGPRPGLRILLVEDNEDTLRFLATMLRRRGHDVVTAGTLAEARAALGSPGRSFDLLLSDIELPDGTGLELIRGLRDRGGFPGIAMSGFGAEEDQQLSRSAGFLDHLIKPIDPARLEAAIQRATAAGREGRSDADADEDEDDAVSSDATDHDGRDAGPPSFPTAAPARR